MQVGRPVPHFFSAAQFAALRRLSDLILPAIGENPGALEAGAPEFLDFLIGQSPLPARVVYRSGLDALNARATAKYRAGLRGAGRYAGGATAESAARAVDVEGTDGAVRRYFCAMRRPTS